MNYIQRHMEEKYGIPYMEYNFFGPDQDRGVVAQHRQLLRRQGQGQHRGRHRKYKPMMQAIIDKYKPRRAGPNA